MMSRDSDERRQRRHWHTVVLAGLVLSGLVGLITVMVIDSRHKTDPVTQARKDYLRAGQEALRRDIANGSQDHRPVAVDPKPMPSRCGMDQPAGGDVLPLEDAPPTRAMTVTNLTHVVTTKLDRIDVWAGALRDYPEKGISGDPNQGVIYLLIESTCEHQQSGGLLLPTPEKRGTLRITRADPDRVAFEYANGGLGTLDLLTNAFA